MFYDNEIIAKKIVKIFNPVPFLSAVFLVHLTRTVLFHNHIFILFLKNMLLRRLFEIRPRKLSYVRETTNQNDVIMSFVRQFRYQVWGTAMFVNYKTVPIASCFFYMRQSQHKELYDSEKNQLILYVF